MLPDKILDLVLAHFRVGKIIYVVAGGRLLMRFRTYPRKNINIMMMMTAEEMLQTA